MVQILKQYQISNYHINLLSQKGAFEIKFEGKKATLDAISELIHDSLISIIK